MRNTLESMLHAGQAELVLQKADEYLGGPGATDPDAQWISLLTVHASGRLRQWSQALSRVERLWKTGPSDPEVIGWLHFYKGSALIYIGDLYRAEAELNQFRALTAQIPKLQWFAGDVVFNLAYVKRVLGDAEACAVLFAEAARTYQATGREGQVPGCHFELAWDLLLAGTPDGARPHLEAATSGLGQSDEPALKTKVAVASALLERLQGELGRSNRICERLVARHDLLPEQLADARWILGCNALQAGHRMAAGMHAEEAYAAAVQHWWPPQLDRINELKTQARIGMVGR